MVGENTSLTGGSFLIEKMPDPSAIWTRGNDKHSEWGGKALTLEDMKPHYFNDLIIKIFKNQGEYANWVVNTNPFEGGSDHIPFLRANIPGLLLWHFTDQFYHTDNDRIDKVSQETLKNVFFRKSHLQQKKKAPARNAPGLDQSVYPPTPPYFYKNTKKILKMTIITIIPIISSCLKLKSAFCGMCPFLWSNHPGSR